MSKRDKSVIRRSVKREMTTIKNLYFNKTNSARNNTVINTNNEDQVIFKNKIITQTIKSNCMSSSNTGYILQIIYNEENELPNTVVSSNLSSLYSNNKHIIFPNSTSPNLSCLYLHKEVNELPIPISPLYLNDEFSSKDMLAPIENNSFETDLGCWATECYVPQTTVNKLLKLMKRYDIIKTENYHKIAELS